MAYIVSWLQHPALLWRRISVLFLSTEYALALPVGSWGCVRVFSVELNREVESKGFWESCHVFSSPPTGKFQMQVLPQCGHAVHEDAPDKVSGRAALLISAIKVVAKPKWGPPQPVFALDLTFRLCLENAKQVRGRGRKNQLESPILSI